jgi:hypothetical protein
MFSRILDGDLAGQPVEAVADQSLGLAGGDQVDGGGQCDPVVQVEGAAAALGEHADDAVVVASAPGPDLAVLVGQGDVCADLPAGADPRIADQPYGDPPLRTHRLWASYSPGRTASAFVRTSELHPIDPTADV